MGNLMKKGFVVCMAAGCVLCVAGSLSAGEIKNAKDKVAVTVYGQVNRAVAQVNDGDSSYTNHVDNDYSSTRFGFKAKAKGSDTLTAGANMEWEYQANPSNNITQGVPSVDPGLGRRKLEVYLDSANLGKLSFGHGPTASDGTSEVDLSGTKVAGSSITYAWTSDFVFYDNAANAASGTRVDGVMSNLDGCSRQDRLRYDTPKFGGFQLSASTYSAVTTDATATVATQHDSVYDAALRYSAKFGDNFKLAAAVGYTDFPSTDAANADDKQVNGSLSVLFSGFSVTLATGEKDLANVTAAGRADSESFSYGKIGYIANLSSMGATAFAIDYGKYEAFSGIKDDEASTYAVYVVQKLSDWSTEVYGGYRVHQLDDRVSTGERFDDISAIWLGARIKF